MDQAERRLMLRSVEVVEDLDATEPGSRFRGVGSLLDPLSAPKLTGFRREVRDRHQRGRPRLCCGKCGKPVYVSLAGTGHPDGRDGRDAFFAHHAGTAADCDWGTVGKHPRDIDRKKFGGVAEGALHNRLKRTLAAMLAADRTFSDVQIEEVVSRPPDWRKPDVIATFRGALIAFDLQLATTQIPTIVHRERFYETNHIRYVWVTSSNDPRNLARQAFQDIYWNNLGQIFAIDEQAAEESFGRGELHVWALTGAPRLDERGLHSVWERRLAKRSEIDWDTASLRPRYPAADFEQSLRGLIAPFTEARNDLIRSVRQREDPAVLEVAARAWNRIALAVGAAPWNPMDEHRVFKAIGVLATAAAGKKMDSSAYAPDQLTAMFNQFLETQACRGWTSALRYIAEVHGHEALLNAASTRAKIDRNLSEQHPDLLRNYATMLDIVFPRSALSRLSGPPVEIRDVE